MALQQVLGLRSDRQRFRREGSANRDDKCIQALADLVVAGRRVQRALVDRDEESPGAQVRLANEVDKLAESAALVRVLVTDAALLKGVEQFEDTAKRLQMAPPDGREILRLSPIVTLIQTYEARHAA